MADNKLTDAAIPELLGADTAANDRYLVVDVSDPTRDPAGTVKFQTRDEAAIAFGVFGYDPTTDVRYIQGRIVDDIDTLDGYYELYLGDPAADYASPYIDFYWYPTAQAVGATASMGESTLVQWSVDASDHGYVSVFGTDPGEASLLGGADFHGYRLHVRAYSTQTDPLIDLRDSSAVPVVQFGLTSGILPVGKYTTAGYLSGPTIFDPTSTNWNDAGFLGIAFSPTSQNNLVWGEGVGAAIMGADGDDGTGRGYGALGATAGDTAGNRYYEAYAKVSADPTDGSRAQLQFFLDGDGSGDFSGYRAPFLVDLAWDDYLTMTMQAEPGQTDPLFVLRDSDGAAFVQFNFTDGATTFTQMQQVLFGKNFGGGAGGFADIITAQSYSEIDLWNGTTGPFFYWYVENALGSLGMGTPGYDPAAGQPGIYIEAWNTNVLPDHNVRAIFNANPTQTEPILQLGNGAGVDLFTLAPSGAVGGVAPSSGWSIKWNGTKWVAAA